ncbi:MAG TPA: hypothetical protein VGO09_01730 [Flavisolibacter sp.]|nr:hypothetical protein [Flavisolibacter sp.]
MRSFSYFILLLFFYSCKTAGNDALPPEVSDVSLLKSGYSKTQIRINDLRKKYLTDFRKAGNDVMKNNIKEEYQKKLHHYLLDSCLKVIDCGNVYVKNIKNEISNNANLLSAEFTDQSCLYTFSNSFPNDEDLNNFPEYKFLTELKKGANTSIKFLYSGDCMVSNPLDSALQTFIIKAVPYIE